MTILAFVPTSPSVTTATDTFFVGIAGWPAGMGVTSSSLINALLKFGSVDCCKLVTLTGQHLRETVLSALKDLVNRVFGPLVSAGDAARSIVACVKDPSLKGCSDANKKTADVIDTLVNDGGGFDYAGAVTLVVETTIKEVGRAFVNQLLAMIAAAIDHLIDVLVHTVCGSCGSNSTSAPKTAPKPAAKPPMISPPGSVALTPMFSLPTGLHLKRPDAKRVLAPETSVWPKVLVFSVAALSTAGAGWFFFRKPAKRW